MRVILGLSLFVLGVGLYFLPYIIAVRRSHPNDKAILVLNLFLGWTFIGWVAALVWAFTNPVKK